MIINFKGLVQDGGTQVPSRLRSSPSMHSNFANFILRSTKQLQNTHEELIDRVSKRNKHNIKIQN